MPAAQQTGSYTPANHMISKTAELRLELQDEGGANTWAAPRNGATPRAEGATPSGASKYRSGAFSSLGGSRDGVKSPSGPVSPAVPGGWKNGRKSGSPGDSPQAARMTENLRAQLTAQIQRLEAHNEAYERHIRELERDMQKRQESYIRREQRYKDEISKLKESLDAHDSNKQWIKLERAGMNLNGTRAEQIVAMHAEIQRALENLVPKRKAGVASKDGHAQPAPAATADAGGAASPSAKDSDFADRLREQEILVNSERRIDNEKRMLVDKLASLRQTLEQQQFANAELQASSKMSKELSERLRSQFEMQEDDREMLIRQVETLRAENSRLKASLEAGPAVIASPEPQPLAPGSPMKRESTLRGPSRKSMRTIKTEQELRAEEVAKAKSYEDIVSGLKQLLLQERGRTKKARAAHMAELQQRTNLQAILRQAVEDTRKTRRAAELSAESGTQGDGRRRSQRPFSAHPSVSLARTPSRERKHSVTAMLPEGSTTDDLLDEDSRQALVDNLLAKEEVMKLLFERTFPGVDVNPESKAATVQRLAEREGEQSAGTATARRGSVMFGGGSPRSSLASNAARNSIMPRAPSRKDTAAARDTSILSSTAGVSRPWVMDVDGMLSDFLGSTPTSATSPVAKLR